MVSDNGSDLKYNNESNSIIENKDTNMAAYLEGEEKALIDIKQMLSDGPPKTNKAIPSYKTKAKQNTKTNIQKN